MKRFLREPDETLQKFVERAARAIIKRRERNFRFTIAVEDYEDLKGEVGIGPPPEGFDQAQLEMAINIGGKAVEVAPLVGQAKGTLVLARAE